MSKSKQKQRARQQSSAKLQERSSFSF